MYVAITRAEEVLYMSHCSKRYMYGQSQYQAPSRFLRELGILSLSRTSSNKTDFTYSGLKNTSNGQDYAELNETKSAGVFSHSSFMTSLKKEEFKPLQDVSKFKVGQIVSHPRYGEGKIVSITDDGLVGDITFEDFGTKSLMLELAPLEIVEG